MFDAVVPAEVADLLPVLVVDAIAPSADGVALGMRSLVPIFMRVGSTVGFALLIASAFLVEPRRAIAIEPNVSPFLMM